MQLLSLLQKRYGSRIDHFTELKPDGLHFHPEKINNFFSGSCDKCTSCNAHIYRQDFPFWVGSHNNKKLMVIAQDAGKGMEDYGINTVFSIHNAYLNRDVYFNASPRHEKYYNLFYGMFNHDLFLQEMYFTDIVKCAYSTENKIKLATVNCTNDILIEISEINPSSILLMGTAAQSAFNTLTNTYSFTLELINEFRCKINNRASIKFQHFRLNKKSVFYIPHLIGNLHVATEKKENFNAFVYRIQSEVKLSLNL